LESVTPVAGAEDVVEEINIEALLVTTTATFVEADDIVEEETRDEGEDEEAGTRMTELADPFKAEAVELVMAELAVDFVDALVVEAGVKEDVLTTAATPLLTGDQNTAGVYTGIGIVIPYPPTPHAGLTGDVNPLGLAVVVAVVVKVVKGSPVEVPAQYPVP
jgi:hypothetical protein